VELQPDESQRDPAVDVFIAELRHWREVADCSQKWLSSLVGYTPSYAIGHPAVSWSPCRPAAAWVRMQTGRLSRWRSAPR
jgi:hypothetical protein